MTAGHIVPWTTPGLDPCCCGCECDHLPDSYTIVLPTYTCNGEIFQTNVQVFKVSPCRYEGGPQEASEDCVDCPVGVWMECFYPTGWVLQANLWADGYGPGGEGCGIAVGETWYKDADADPPGSDWEFDEPDPKFPIFRSIEVTIDED